MIVERDADAGTTTIVIPTPVCAAAEKSHGLTVKVQVKKGHMYVVGRLNLIAEVAVPLDVAHSTPPADLPATMAKLFAEKWGEELVSETLACFIPETDAKTREAVAAKMKQLEWDEWV